MSAERIVARRSMKSSHELRPLTRLCCIRCLSERRICARLPRPPLHLRQLLYSPAFFQCAIEALACSTPAWTSFHEFIPLRSAIESAPRILARTSAALTHRSYQRFHALYSERRVSATSPLSTLRFISRKPIHELRHFFTL